jgi:phosphoglycolate phosphatase
VSGLLVLWDIDHTLINAGGASPGLYAAVYRHLFGARLPATAPMAGRTDRAITLETLTLAGVRDPAGHVDAFLAELGARAGEFRGAVARRGRVLPGAAQALAALARQAPPPVQSVLTGNIRPLAEAKLGALGLTAHLDLEAGAYGDHHESRAELVHLARRRAALAYGRDFGGPATVLIGDTPMDVAAALATGARAIGVATGAFPAADLAAVGADAVLTSLADTTAVLTAVLAPPQRPVPPALGALPPVAPGVSQPGGTPALRARRATGRSSPGRTGMSTPPAEAPPGR